MGVLYVVDSVTRQWVEAARRAGQPAGSAAPDGTFAAGVNRVTELLTVLMTDIINNAPEDQKVRTTRRYTRRITKLSHYHSRASSIRPILHSDLPQVLCMAYKNSPMYLPLIYPLPFCIETVAFFFFFPSSSSKLALPSFMTNSPTYVFDRSSL